MIKITKKFLENIWTRYKQEKKEQTLTNIIINMSLAILNTIIKIKTLNL